MNKVSAVLILTSSLAPLFIFLVSIQIFIRDRRKLAESGRIYKNATKLTVYASFESKFLSIHS